MGLGVGVFEGVIVGAGVFVAVGCGVAVGAIVVVGVGMGVDGALMVSSCSGTAATMAVACTGSNESDSLELNCSSLQLLSSITTRTNTAWYRRRLGNR